MSSILPLKIHIENLRLRTIIGFNPEERKHRQDVIINIHFTYDASDVCRTDNPDDCVDYKTLKYRIIKHVEESSYSTLEYLAKKLLDIVMEPPLILSAAVKAEKPNALRYADSVSVLVEAKR